MLVVEAGPSIGYRRSRREVEGEPLGGVVDKTVKCVVDWGAAG
jgi:hypothetical protein